jgi:transcriptional regulator with XRE-family HTH domain
MTEKDLYYFQRRKKKILLKQIANHLKCSISLLSRYEREGIDICPNKENGYRQFIDSYQPKGVKEVT